MKAYKITDKNFKCKNFQYQLNKKFVYAENIKLCSRGFHACKNPMDCLNYQNLYDSRFFEVECSGNIKEGKDKLVCSEIIFTKEFSLKEYIDLCPISLKNSENTKTSSKNFSQLASSGDYSKLAASGDSPQLASSGNYSKLASSGDSPQLASSGDDSKLASSGCYSKLASSGYSSQLASSGSYSNLTSSGDNSQLASSGNNSNLTSSGNNSKLASSGNNSKLASSGNYSKLSASGEASIAAGIGVSNRVKVSTKDSLLILVNYRNGKPFQCFGKKPGQKIQGKIIKINTWYWFENETLMEEINE